MTPAAIHVLFVLAQAQRIAPTHLQAFPESRHESVFHQRGWKPKKHIGDDDAIHNTSWWVTQRFRNMPGVYIMLSHVWEEFDLFCMTSTNAERLPCFIWIPHLSVPSSKSQILANTTIFVDSPTPPNQNCQLFYWVKIGKITIEKPPHPILVSTQGAAGKRLVPSRRRLSSGCIRFCGKELRYPPWN